MYKNFVLINNHTFSKNAAFVNKYAAQINSYQNSFDKNKKIYFVKKLLFIKNKYLVVILMENYKSL